MVCSAQVTQEEIDSKEQPLILLVEEHKITADIERDYFLGAGFRILVAHTVDEMRTLVAENSVDLLMIDVGFGRDKGLLLLEQARRSGKNPGMKVLVSSVVGSPEIRSAAMKAGADGFLAKPAPRPKILKEIKGLVSQKSRDSERIRKNFEVEVAVKNGAPLRLQSLDLSEDGIHLQAVSDFPAVGSSVSLTLHLPECADPVVLDGVVVRHTAEGLGVKFVAVSRSAKRHIDKFLLAHTMEGRATAYYL
jgi:CheY-like chemotaxis protein